MCSSDLLLFTINGQDVMFGRPISILTGGVANVGVGENFNSTASVRLFDRGSSLGGFSTSSSGQQTQRVSGGGSTYEVTYRVGN